MVAILAEDIQLEAVCSVAGNKELDMTTENSLRVVQLMGADVPVYRGCPEPLVKFLCPDRLEKQSRGDRGKMVDENGKVHMMHSDYLEIPAVTIHEQKKFCTGILCTVPSGKPGESDTGCRRSSDEFGGSAYNGSENHGEN